MEPQAHSLVIKAPTEVLWTIFYDLARKPERYERNVQLKSLSPAGENSYQRRIERNGRIVEETISFHLDALMMEITSPTLGLTLIHQIIPSGEAVMLNLAATSAIVDEDEGLRDTETINLAALGETIKETALRLSG